jgi:hypothetical protein
MGGVGRGLASIETLKRGSALAVHAADGDDRDRSSKAQQRSIF